jgi:hypothetical protein
MEARLRKLLPRLGPRDRRVILDAIGSLYELATLLHMERTKAPKAPRADIAAITIEDAAQLEARAAAGTLDADEWGRLDFYRRARQEHR